MTETDAPTHGYRPQNEPLIKRLHRIEGQLRGIEKMIGEDRHCIDVVQQISAVKAAIDDKVALGMLDEHIRHCMTTAAIDQQRREG